MRATDRQSPLPSHDELDRRVFNGFVPYLLAAAALFCAAIQEWESKLEHTPRPRWVYTSLAAMACGVCAWQYLRLRRHGAGLHGQTKAAAGGGSVRGRGPQR